MPTLEERIRALEMQMHQLLRGLEPSGHDFRWESIVGTFSNSEGFDEAIRLGREYRESLRPADDADST